MAEKCQVCEIEEAFTNLTAFGQSFPARIPLCAACHVKARLRDPEIWHTIRGILQET
jgi:hypothetical protein